MNSNDIVCPLKCSNSTIKKIYSIKTEDIIKLYKRSRSLRLNISSEFDEIDMIDLYNCHNCGIEFFYPRLTGSENYYRSLSKLKDYYVDGKDEYDYAKTKINSGDKVLDVGCGEGHFSKLIPESNYVGLELVKAYGDKKITIYNESIELHSNFKTGKYDVVCAFQVLEHIDDVHSFIEACIKCLRSTGLLIFSVPSNESWLAHKKNSILNIPPHHLNRFSDESLKNIATIFDLNILDIYHERMVNNNQLEDYLTVILDNLFGKKDFVIDSSYYYLVKNKIQQQIAKILSKAFVHHCLFPVGQAVTVVYQKK